LTNSSIFHKLNWEENTLANELHILKTALCKTAFLIGASESEKSVVSPRRIMVGM